jgi:apolipoprotein N-acyltransferase
MRLPAWLHPRRIRARLAAGRGWRAAAIQAFAGALGALAMAPFFFWPALALSLIVLVWSLDGAARRDAPLRAGFFTGLSFAMGYFLAGTFWIAFAFANRGDEYILYILPIVPAFCALLAVFWGFAGALQARFGGRGPMRVLVFALLFAVFEWMRGHVLSGLPWNLPAYAWRAGGAVSQSASVLGVYGLSLLTLYVLAAPAALLGQGARGARAAPALAGAGLLLIVFTLGGLRLLDAPTDTHEGVRFRIVQANIGQREKWDLGLEPVLERYLEFSTRPGLDEVTHVLWPEGALPYFPFEDADALEAMGEAFEGGQTLLFGLSRRTLGEEGEVLGYNSFASLTFPGGLARLDRLYDKVWLVPFGEYMPLEGVVQMLGIDALSRLGGYSSGPGARVLEIAGAPAMMPLICYEAIFPNFVAGAPARPDWFFNLSNDAWFGNTTGPRQHLNQALYRSIETGVPMVRTAAQGISGVSDGYGRMRVRIPPRAEGVYDVELPEAAPTTLYARAGDRLFFALVFVISAFIAWRRVRRRASGPFFGRG